MKREIARIILEYLKVLLWPLLVATFLLIFKKNIQNFIGRLVRARFPGGEFETERFQVEAQEAAGIESEENMELAIRTQGELLEITKKYYEEQIIQFRNEKQNNQDIINKLVEQLSTKNLQIEFERIYRAIFGSQIALLRYLLTKGTSGESIFFIQIHFENIKSIYVPTFDLWTVDNYLAYLINQGLIIFLNNSYFISEKGMTFISYITNANYSDSKGL